MYLTACKWSFLIAFFACRVLGGFWYSYRLCVDFKNLWLAKIYKLTRHFLCVLVMGSAGSVADQAGLRVHGSRECWLRVDDYSRSDGSLQPEEKQRRLKATNKTVHISPQFKNNKKKTSLLSARSCWTLVINRKRTTFWKRRILAFWCDLWAWLANIFFVLWVYTRNLHISANYIRRAHGRVPGHQLAPSRA